MIKYFPKLKLAKNLMEFPQVNVQTFQKFRQKDTL